MRTLSCLRQLGQTPSCGLLCQLLFIAVCQIHLLCGATVSPGDPYSATQRAGKAVHSVTHGAPQLLSGGQALNVTAVPHDPASQGEQHQEGPRVHQQVSKIPALDLEWGKDPQQQGYHTQQVHEHSKHKGQLTVGQAIIFRCHGCEVEEKRQTKKHLLVPTL